ncbi:unnamed protein product, partial [Choristocarpus tenellus]
MWEESPRLPTQLRLIRRTPAHTRMDGRVLVKEEEVSFTKGDQSLEMRQLVMPLEELPSLRQSQGGVGNFSAGSGSLPPHVTRYSPEILLGKLPSFRANESICPTDIDDIVDAFRLIQSTESLNINENQDVDGRNDVSGKNAMEEQDFGDDCEELKPAPRLATVGRSFFNWRSNSARDLLGSFVNGLKGPGSPLPATLPAPTLEQCDKVLSWARDEAVPVPMLSKNEDVGSPSACAGQDGTVVSALEEVVHGTSLPIPFLGEVGRLFSWGSMGYSIKLEDTPRSSGAEWNRGVPSMTNSGQASPAHVSRTSAMGIRQDNFYVPNDGQIHLCQRVAESASAGAVPGGVDCQPTKVTASTLDADAQRVHKGGVVGGSPWPPPPLSSSVPTTGLNSGTGGEVEPIIGRGAASIDGEADIASEGRTGGIASLTPSQQFRFGVTESQPMERLVPKAGISTLLPKRRTWLGDPKASIVYPTVSVGVKRCSIATPPAISGSTMLPHSPSKRRRSWPATTELGYIPAAHPSSGSEDDNSHSSFSKHEGSGGRRNAQGKTGVIRSRRCQHGGCNRHPNFGLDSNRRAHYCAAHKLPGMVNVKAPRCRHPGGCGRNPVYGHAGDTRATFCVAHKSPSMRDIKNRSCEQEDCPRQPSFGNDGDCRAVFCAAHKRPGMVNIRRAR